ncbi:fimbria/pilus periplasmic chaperone [Buttiauxella sp. A2-C1_F]|uniref:fimbrial biogenesis chaperone n=1 Tax=unclassified Buttiauxella TaxID=2634062 RepID=UPI001E4E5A96|nr:MULTISPECIES: fimbria/pilus periplasmic chaperone [unclassified Buttiauxella]MCE0801443.1 fimbria/pilus periplasmic chaperone [Buttiauxella sp. W03-F01]MCE0846606.1 fimbria/pilus periplasmic chaperone [Buttiauxella sp. A2-C1_F]
MNIYSIGLFGLLLFISSAHAGILINSTRVIYPADSPEVTLGMTNNATTPRLIQSWIDDGDSNASPETVSVPFVVTPPIFRINPGQGQSLRIVFTGGNVPKDRESVFWLNILEIQPKPNVNKDTIDSYLKFSVRSRLKIFFRPKGLTGSPDGAPATLTWRLIQNGSGFNLECINPSAYNVSISNVRFKNEAENAEVNNNGMCPAKGKKLFPVNKPVASAASKIVFITIDDLGGFKTNEADYRR